MNYILNNLHKIPVQQISFSQRWRYFQRFPERNSKRTCFHNAVTRASHINHTTMNTVPSRSSKVQANSSCPKSTAAYHSGNDTITRSNCKKKKTINLRIVETLNYGATGDWVVL